MKYGARVSKKPARKSTPARKKVKGETMSSRSYFRYDDDRAQHVSFPLGGIGTGSIGISAAGRLIDWEIANHPDKGNCNGFTNFTIRAESGGKVIGARVLNGPFKGNFAGDRGAGSVREFGFGVRREYLTGLPHFRDCKFDGFYPTAEMELRDPEFPGAVDMLAFSPLIPQEDRASSMPVAMFEFVVENTTDKPIEYSIIGSLGNLVKGPHAARVAKTAHATGMVNSARDADPRSPDFGQLIMATDEKRTSWQHEWYRGSWFDSLEVFWKDMTTPGPLKDRVYADNYINRRPDGRYRYRGHSCLAAHRSVAPGERATIRFAIAWYFPNFEKNWLNMFGYVEEPKNPNRVWKSHYATLWPDVDAVAEETFARWPSLKSRTLAYRDALRGTTMPDSVLDAVSANISILKSPTVLRLEDGTFYGFEGTDATDGSCEGSCTHVWNYQQTLPYLFGALERSMRDADFAHNMDPANGGMSFRLCLPIGVGRFDVRPCADGQFGNVMKTYRDWKLSGDDAWLRKNWPAVKRAIEFAWHPGNHDRWDPEKTGVLWGAQHHTLDMELFGPNSWLTGFYLGALLAGAKMARHLGETATADEYEAIFAKGKAWMNEHLFNGEYFYHRVDLNDLSQVKAFNDGPVNPVLVGSMTDIYWSAEHGEVKYQIGEGCLIDQVLAQWHANIYGLGDIYEPAKIDKAMRAIMRLNFKERLGDVVNPCRVFGLEDESGTVVCEWPAGARRPTIPVPYSQETFHGCEYQFGSMLMQIGKIADGVRVFAAVRDRYRGHNRNPWNEMECGSNYARSMAAHAGLLALSGFEFDATLGLIGFAPKVRSGASFRTFWSAGAAWGTASFAEKRFELSVSEGTLNLRALRLQGGAPRGARATLDGKALASSHDTANAVLAFAPTELRAGSTLRIDSAAIGLAALPEIADL